MTERVAAELPAVLVASMAYGVMLYEAYGLPSRACVAVALLGVCGASLVWSVYDMARLMKRP